jgi:hypothetical protein
MSSNGAVSDKGGASDAASVLTDGCGHGKVSSFPDCAGVSIGKGARSAGYWLIEGVPHRRDHIDATGVEGADTSVIMTAGTAVMAVAAVAVTAYACAAAVEGAAAVDVTVAAVA